MSVESEPEGLHDMLAVGQQANEQPHDTNGGNKIISLVAAGAVGATAVLGIGGLVFYNRDYVAEDSCTSLDAQAVNVLSRWSPSDVSRMMHDRLGGVIPKFWSSSETSLVDVVAEQEALRGYAIDENKVAKANGYKDATKVFDQVGVYCLQGFGPELVKTSTWTFVKGAPVDTLWKTGEQLQGADRKQLIADAAQANSDAIFMSHGLPDVGAYPMGAENVAALLDTPGLTDQAKDVIKSQVVERGLFPAEQ